jgi:acetyl-CoA carboxylase biotin carboxyl carrier protein
MAFDREGLERVLRAFDEGDWDEVHLTADGIELHLSVLGDPGPDSPQVAAAAPDTASVKPPPAGAGPDTAGATPATAAAADHDPGTLQVVAQSPGIFWRSPQPGAPPYADIGDQVAAGATLCIVEVMKLMNHVTAPCAGTVTEVIAANGEQVARGQPLLRLRPDEAGEC